MTPLFSLIIPYRRQPAGLHRLLESIHRQSLRSLEVILVDDHSGDNVGDIVRSWQNKGLSITLLTEPYRIYTLRCRLDGIRHAQGKIIGFADADDVLWGTQALHRNVQAMLNVGADILHFRTALLDEDGNFVKYAPNADPFSRRIDGTERIFSRYCQENFYACTSLWNKIFSCRVCKQSLNCYDERFILRCEDSWLLLNILLKSKIYIGSDELGYGYVWRERRMTTNPERTVAYYRFYKAVEDILSFHNIPQCSIDLFQSRIKDILCNAAGHMCRAWQSLSPQEWKAHADALKNNELRDDLLEALITANSVNADRLLAIHKVFP